MHIYILFVLFLATNCLAGSPGKGKVFIRGEIIESACTIATGDELQEIDFNNVGLNDLKKNVIIEKYLTLQLINCRLEKNKGGHWNTATITFDGSSDSVAAGLFKLSGQGGGVALRITDTAGMIAIPGKALSAVKLNENTTDIYFKMALVSNGGRLLAGRVSSLLPFMIVYQ